MNAVGATSVRVTELGLGTAQLGDLYATLDQYVANEIVDEAWRAGIRYFDTAPFYGLGLAEQRLGLALADRQRSDYTLSSKVGRVINENSGTTRWCWDFSETGVQRSIRESLDRLRNDHLDIVLIHDPQDNLDQAIAEAYPALRSLRDRGAIGAIGVGTGDVAALTRFVRECELDVIMLAGRYTLLDRSASTALLPLCADRGVSILNVGVFNSGLLATDAPADGARYEYQTASRSLVRSAQCIARVARAHGMTLPEAALRFAASDGQIASVVVGADGPEQIRANAALLDQQVVRHSEWDEFVAHCDAFVAD
ncbi:aldo/keto reductase [Rathayibacter soli]|uniref:aldo/keto reductase n=1 Tax=Rathayibacter soli TaxID=3144168 RepID=UPI0027E55C0E|nr:aldo/keto reductase [Glaciibacter superstes]